MCRVKSWNGRHLLSARGYRFVAEVNILFSRWQTRRTSPFDPNLFLDLTNLDKRPPLIFATIHHLFYTNLSTFLDSCFFVSSFCEAFNCLSLFIFRKEANVPQLHGMLYLRPSICFQTLMISCFRFQTRNKSAKKLLLPNWQCMIFCSF